MSASTESSSHRVSRPRAARFPPRAGVKLLPALGPETRGGFGIKRADVLAREQPVHMGACGRLQVGLNLADCCGVLRRAEVGADVLDHMHQEQPAAERPCQLTATGQGGRRRITEIGGDEDSLEGGH